MLERAAARGGMKSIQFVRTDAGWRISAAGWDDDRPRRQENRGQQRRNPGPR
jgi:hypothetical protein